MKETSIAKIKKVWETDNKVLKPTKQKLYLELVDQIASLFTIGTYYYYILNFENIKMEYVHPSVDDVLGINPLDFSVEKILDLMHPDDLTRMHQKEQKVLNFFLNKITKEEMLKYKVVYLMRLKNAEENYRTILHQVKTLTVSEDGKIQQVIGIHTDVTHLNIPIDHKVSFISQTSPSYFSTETDEEYTLMRDRFVKLFTNREKEIIRKISEGYDFNNLAEHFNLSPHTINTHKKNILKKSHCKNITELVTKCIREGII